MNINFTSLHIENFMSVGTMDIDFSNYVGFNVISGENHSVEDNAKSNGSGKSSIFEALVWCLTGETIRGNKDIVNHFGDNGAYVCVKFKYDGHDYAVHRYKEHKEHKTNLFVYIDNVDKSGKGIRDTQKLLEEYLPDLTPSLIGSVIVLGQGLPSRFTNNTPSARKEVLERLTNSDFMIEDIKSKIAGRKSALSEMLQEAQDELLRQETSVEVHTQAINKSRLELSQMADIKTLVLYETELSNRIELLESQYQSLCSDLSEAEKQYNDCKVQSCQVELQEKDDTLAVTAKYVDKIQEIEIKIAGARKEISYLRDRIAKAKSVKDVCPTCGQRLPDVHIPNTKEDEDKVAELSTAFDKMQETKRNLENELSTEKNAVREKYAEERRTVSAELDRLNGIKREKSDLKSGTERTLSQYREELRQTVVSIAQHESRVESLNATILESEKEIEKCRDKMDKVTVERDALDARMKIVTKFETIAKRDFRGYLLQDIIVYINQRSKEYCKQVFGTEIIDFSLDGNAISISYNGKQYEALSGGERQKLDIIIQLAIRDVLCAYTNFSTNIIVLDEIFDNLDDIGSGNIVELISNNLTDIKGIYIISHHAKSLNIPYDNELMVVKNESGVSYLI